MFKTEDDLKQYIRSNYPEVTDNRIAEGHWDLHCTTCKIARGFRVLKRQPAQYKIRSAAGTYLDLRDDPNAPVTYLFSCPVCKSFKQWIVFEIHQQENDSQFKTHYYRVTSLPNEGLEEIEELPAEPASLRVAYKQAIRAMDANAYLAAAAMFRRALQIITRELLGAKPGNLANELREVIGKSYNGTTLTASFTSIGYIIKEAGNQGAHPDEDPDLLEFTSKDAQDLQLIFMEMVSELFVIPAATRKAKEDFLLRRKIISKP